MYIHICRHTHVCAYVEREKGSKRREEKKKKQKVIYQNVPKRKVRFRVILVLLFAYLILTYF